MSIFFLKRLKKRNNYDNFTTTIVTSFSDSYYNIKMCSPYIGNYFPNIRYRWR